MKKNNFLSRYEKIDYRLLVLLVGIVKMSTNTSWIFDDASHVEFRDIPSLKDTVVRKFLDDHILSHPSSTRLLQNLSNIWVMVANYTSDTSIHRRDDETPWKDIMGERQYTFLKENRELIIGYILFGKKTEDIHYIELCDTAVRGYDVLKYMINKYKRNIAHQKANNRQRTAALSARRYVHKVDEPHILPDTIIPSASGYWKKYLQEEYKIKTEKQLTNWIQGIEDPTWVYTTHMCQTAPDLNYNIVRDGWEYLYENWDDINGRHNPNNDHTILVGMRPMRRTLGNSQDFLNEL